MPQNKTALITGGAAGLGYEFAKLFAHNRYNLVLVGRDEEKLLTAAKELETSNNVTVKTITKDLSHSKSAQEIFDQLKEEKIQIDILVNNAGFATYGHFDQMKPTEIQSEIDVNISALTQLTRLFLPEMIERHSGKILNLASIAAFAPGPFMSVYFATKAYVLSLSEALSEELKGTGVSVTVLCPGPTKTGFADRASIQNSNLYTNKPMRAGEVAQIGYSGLMNNKTVILPGFKNKLFVMLLRIIPRSLMPKMVKYIVNK